MTRFATSYPTGQSTRVCAGSGRALAEGEHAIAVLVEDASTGRMCRLDFAEDSWAGGARPEASRWRMIGQWRSLIGRKESPTRPVLDDDGLLELLQQIEPGEPKRDALRCVIALLLLRRRVLVQEGARGGALLLRRRGDPRPPEGPPPIEVRDAGVDEAAVNEVMAEIEPLLGLPGGTTDAAGGAS